MRRLPMERPTDHYDARLFKIDEQICALLEERREISNHNPGYPPFKSIESWADRYHLYPDLLKSLFGMLMNEEGYLPAVEPTGFRKHLPVLRCVEQDNQVYTLTGIRQYENASVVNLSIHGDFRDEAQRNHTHLELELDEGYRSHIDQGASTGGNAAYGFVVSPALPDDLNGITFVFREYERPLKRKPTGMEIVFRFE
ncbi:hypothetical protein SAMN05216378_3023 [Paenibacillus catalpae]|uniref:Uncharacterized protein n=1 Tax=Paenibacillus catalpae TaxID=1045775 RepID=A0A1I2AAL9_9BACL|nr:hypothetical protein [Paenibacillus catalpae]SFE41011.1 hypothetical protein SAMN05216378_3023 [Paenibacillus catalpae]